MELLKRQITDPRELRGKTIEDFHADMWEGAILLMFEGGTFAVLDLDETGANRGLPKGLAGTPVTHAEFVEPGEVETGIRLGLISRESLAAYRATKRQTAAERKEAEERAELARLKAKFEGGEP